MQNRAIMLRYKKDKKTQEKKIPKNPIHRRGKASGPPPKKIKRTKFIKKTREKKMQTSGVNNYNVNDGERASILVFLSS